MSSSSSAMSSSHVLNRLTDVRDTKLPERRPQQTPPASRSPPLGVSGQKRNEQIGGGLSMVKKVILIVLGSVGILISVGVLVIGAALLALTGGDGFIGTGAHDVHTDTHGLVSEPGVVGNRSRLGDAGAVTLRFDVASDKPVFLGVGPADQVDAYLGNADVEEVNDFHASPFKLDTTTRGSPDGALRGAPADAPFWSAKASGTHPVLDWRVGPGSYRFVLLSADGSADVTVRAVFSARIPFVRTLAKWFVGGSIVGLAVAVFLLIWGIRTKRNREPAFAGTYPGQFMPGFPSQPYGQPAQSPYPPPGYGQPPPEPGQRPPYFPPPPPEQPAAAAEQPAAAAERPARPAEERPRTERTEGDGTGDTLGSST
jgi:hypothetical protein